MRKIIIGEKSSVYIVSIIVALCNVFFIYNEIASYCIIFVEAAYLIYLWMRKQYLKYLCYYTIFLSLSMEYAGFIGKEDFYSFKNIRFLGLNLGIWLLVPLLISAACNYHRLISEIKRYRVLLYGTRLFIMMNVIAMFVGMLGILINDNDIRSLKGYFSFYVDSLYTLMLFPVSVLIAFVLALICDREHIIYLEKALQGILWGTVVQGVTSRVFNISGTYGGTSTVMMSMVSVFLVFLLLYSCYSNCKNKKLNIGFALIGLAVLLTGGASGKLYLSLVVLILALLMFAVRTKNLKKKMLLFGVFVIGLFSVSIIFDMVALRGGKLAGYKLYEAKQILQVSKWNMSYFSAMEASPRVRIGEVLNTTIEYLHKPLYFITGKGFGGTIRDYTGFFNMIPVSARSGAFSDEEFSAGVFASMHEISTVYLAFGFLGIILFAYLLKYCLKFFAYSFWLFVGLFWYVLYYGYSITITTFGVTAMMYGLYQCSVSKEGKQTNDYY